MQSPLYLSGGSDFVINSGLSQVVTFSPEARVHSLSINITIVDDDVYEGDEILCVSLSTSTTNLVDFNPASLTIEENDSKTIVLLYCITITINYHAIDITIGFNSTTYTVTERDSRVALCIRVISGEFDDTATVNVRLNTVSGTADCKQINR